MKNTNNFSGNQNLAYDDYELFGLKESDRPIDSSAFEALFGKDSGEIEKDRRTGVKKTNVNDNNRSRRSLSRLFSSLLTVVFILFLFSVLFT
jgi:hypothetical protein